MIANNEWQSLKIKKKIMWNNVFLQKYISHFLFFLVQNPLPSADEHSQLQI